MRVDDLKVNVNLAGVSGQLLMDFLMRINR